ncbi:outer membrane protein assembly factor BamB family protein, partial [Rhodocaloribacter sp.]
RWTFETPDAITAPPLITRSTVYVGTMGRMLYGVDRSTGAKLWEHRLKGRVKSPMAAREGILVVLTEPHEVYLFRPAKKALAAGK